MDEQFQKGMRLTQLVCIRDLLRRGWTLGDLRQEGRYVYFTNGGEQYRMDENGDCSVSKWNLAIKREDIRFPYDPATRG